MSLEPPTTAHVIFHTTKGPVEVEIWAKEAGEIGRSFLTNCVNNRYVGNAFTKIIRDYTVETEALEPATKHRNEFHSRIRFNKRGMLGAVRREGPYSSADGFFITMNPAPEFDGKFVPLGRVVGDTFYNVAKINQGDLAKDKSTPVHPVSITKVEVPTPYFTDLAVEENIDAEVPAKKTKSKKRTAVKLSYDDEDENENVAFKMRSAHELLDDKKLSKGFVGKKTALADPVVNIIPEKSPELQVFENTAIDSDRDLEPVVEQKTSRPSQKVRTRDLRDPAIDSDFDPYLDLSDAENIDDNVLSSHRF